MKFVNDATAKDTAFIKCFPDDSGVYARVLTETELDTLRVKSRTFNGNEKRTPELMDRRFKILHLQRALSGWEGLEFEDGSPIPFSKEMIKELWEVNPNLMGIIYSCVSSELSFVKAAEEKNSGTGADAERTTRQAVTNAGRHGRSTGWNLPAAPVPHRKRNSCPTTCNPCISGKSATSTLATS